MRTSILLLLSVALVGAACQNEGAAADRVTLGAPEVHQSGGLPANLQSHIDEGNAAYRAKDYEGALRHYQEAADKDPNQPTAWFGIAMAASALGNEELAESARQRVQQLDPNLGAAAHGAPTEKPHP